MQVYCCDLTLHDYLFFATTERGKVAETGPFLHNYALTYAFGWAHSPWYNAVQKPRYREELAGVGQKYITPAKLIRGSYLLSQYNTLSESFRLSKTRSVGYPDWGYIKCFRPGSLFRCYAVVKEGELFPAYIRLGKFMAKAAVHILPAEHIEQKTSFALPAQIHKELTYPLLNWNDLATTTRPVAFDILANSLPSRLIENPVFDGVASASVLATFHDEHTGKKRFVQIPLQMGYFGANTCESW